MLKQKEPKKQRRKNDLSGPRFRPKEYTTKLITNELYKEWKSKNRQFSYLTYSEFKEVWWMLCELIIDTTVNETEGVRIPYYLGDFSLGYVKTYEKLVDNAASNLVGEDIPYINTHTNGKSGKIIWSVSHSRKKNNACLLYAFHACKRFKAKASGSFFKTPEKYKDAKLTKWQISLIKSNK